MVKFRPNSIKIPGKILCPFLCGTQQQGNFFPPLKTKVLNFSRLTAHFLDLLGRFAFLRPQLNSIIYSLIRIHKFSQAKMSYFKLFLLLQFVCYIRLIDINRTEIMQKLQKCQKNLIDSWRWLQCLKECYFKTPCISLKRILVQSVND